jgi:6-phosphofructokinase 1
VLASLFGVKAVEMALAGDFGKMVTYKNNDIKSISLADATKEYHFVNKDSYLVQAARGLGISFGD